MFNFFKKSKEQKQAKSSFFSSFTDKLGDSNLNVTNTRTKQNQDQFSYAQEKIEDESVSFKEKKYWKKDRDKAARRQCEADRENKNFILGCICAASAIALIASKIK